MGLALKQGSYRRGDPLPTGPTWTIAKETSNPLSADALFARCSPAVVRVETQDCTGSGFLVSAKGLIVTNYHVIRDAHSADVVLADKTKLSVLGVAALDREADLAILKFVGPIGIQPLELAGNNLPPVGTKVYAIGNPLGRFANTLSDGLVSAHRENGALAEFPRMPTMIQTTAPISHGSSGGPLLGADGKVVGVTTLIYGKGQNLNLAVPASQVAKLLLRCEDEGRLTQFPLIQDTDAAAYIKRGDAWMEKKEYDKAIQDFSEAIRLEPRSAWAYYGRGYAGLYKDTYDKAIQDFNEAIRLFPNFAAAYFYRGRAWWRKKEYDRAEKDFETANRLDPKRFPK